MNADTGNPTPSPESLPGGLRQRRKKFLRPALWMSVGVFIVACSDDSHYLGGTASGVSSGAQGGGDAGTSVDAGAGGTSSSSAGSNGTSASSSVSGACVSVRANAASRQGEPCQGGASDDGCEACYCTPEGIFECSPNNCPDAACPPHVPPQGAACSGAPCECDYATTCDEPHRAACVDGKWRVTYSACAPDCPSSPPPTGDRCWDGQARCDYADQCAHSACLGGYAGAGNGDSPYLGRWETWADERPGCEGSPLPLPTGSDVCPATAPPNTSSCTADGRSCFYGNGCGGLVTARCSSGTWSVSSDACDPSCPSTRPRTGDACSVPVQGWPGCDYADANSCATYCVCMNGQWGCYENCVPKDGWTAGAETPGVVPTPFSRCAPGSWCPEVGSTCGVTGISCVCMSSGWQCL